VIKAALYTVPTVGHDRWWRPAVPGGPTTDRCIKAIVTKPSVTGRSVTHHANSTFVPGNTTTEPDACGGRRARGEHVCAHSARAATCSTGGDSPATRQPAGVTARAATPCGPPCATAARPWSAWGIHETVAGVVRW